MDAAPESDSQRVWSMRTKFSPVRGGGSRSGSGCPDVGHLEGILTSLVRASPLIDRGNLAESLAAGSPTIASLGSPTAHPYDAPFPESSSPARPPRGNGASRGRVWLCCRDVKKTCALPIARPVRSNYSCWRPNARRHGLGERECLVLVGRDHCAATWMKGIFFFITKIRQAVKDTFFHEGRRRYPA